MRVGLRLSALALVLSAGLLASPSRGAPQPPLVTGDTYRLANGLTVILEPDRTLRNVAVIVSYAVGRANDPEGYSGLAHLTEHLSFHGSRHLQGQDPYTMYERAGASSVFGETTADSTRYGAVLPASELENAFWLESDRMAFTLESLDDSTLELERQIVKDEIAERASVERALAARWLSIVYPAGHAFGRTSDSWGDLEAIRLRDVRWFFQHWYRPDNATLVVVGDFDPAEARALIDRYFAPIVTPHAPLERTSLPAPELQSVHRVTIASPLASDALIYAWVGPKTLREDNWMSFVDVLVETRLRRLLVDKLGLVTALRVEHPDLGLQTFFVVKLRLAKPVDARRVDVLVEDTVLRLLAEPIDPAEFVSVKIRVGGFFVAAGRSLESRVRLRTPPDNPFAEALEAVRNARVEDIQALLRRYLRLDRRVVIQQIHDPDASLAGDVLEETETP